MVLEKVVLDGKFVRLEPLEEHHREAIRPAAQHPEFFAVTTSALGTLYDPYFDNALTRGDGRHECAIAVWPKSEKRFIGMTRYLNIEEAHKKLEIGATWYEPSTWGGPVNPACKLLLMSHALGTLGFHRVEYKTDLRNLPRRAAILKLGAHQEGIFRKQLIMADGHVRDSVYFSIIDTDWPAAKAGLQERLAAPSR